MARRNHTIAKISFYTHELTANRIDAFDQFDPKLKGAVTKVMYADRLGAPSGRFSVNVKPFVPRQLFGGIGKVEAEGKPFATYLQDGDWWVLEIIKNGTPYKLGFGRIDSLGVDIQADKGQGVVVEAIDGRAYGFGLEDTPVYFNPFDPLSGVEQQVNLQAVNEFAGSPADVITKITDVLMGANSSLLGPVPAGTHAVPAGIGIGNVAGMSWVQLLNTSRVQSGLRGGVAIPQLISPDNPYSEQSLWALMDAWRNPTLNELFVETDPLSSQNEAFLVLREKPFVNVLDGPASPWFALTSWDVDWNTLTSVQLTRGPGRFNHFMIMGALTSQITEDTYGLYPPDKDYTSIKERGLHRMHESSNYTASSQLTGNTFPGDSALWEHLVECWNVLNHQYWSGKIVIHEMRPEIRKGQKIYLLNGPPAGYSVFPTDLGVRSAAMSFYVEGVQHDFIEAAQPIATTTLTLSQGFVEAFRLPAIADAIASNSDYANTLIAAAIAKAGSIDIGNNPEVLNISDELKVEKITAQLDSETKIA